MALEVFNRHEKKYLIDDKIYQKLRDDLGNYMELDFYNKNMETSPICNLYYDTDDSFVIRTSIKKPQYKEKLRLRSYGIPKSGDIVYAEIKKKVCGFVNKRRSALPLEQAYSFLQTANLPQGEFKQNTQVLKEIQYILQQYQLTPKIYLAYQRRAYFSKTNDDLRVSFDREVTTRRTDLFLESGVYGQPLLQEGHWIMEIKTTGCMPVWLTRILSENKIFPISFSKYGREYNNYLQEGDAEQPQTISNITGVNQNAFLGNTVAI